VREHQKTSTPRRVTTTIGRKCTSNDVDLVELNEYRAEEQEGKKPTPRATASTRI
jgi:hypothetical protein